MICQLVDCGFCDGSKNEKKKVYFDSIDPG